MGIINRLDNSISNIIAAGEVVENPAAMIKELIENSIDAKSKNIKIYLSGQNSYYKIIDDGIGMDKTDIKICIERHTTSKIKTKDDVFNLTTYGFRGEALASISSVSKMTIISKQENENIAHKMLVYGGEIKEFSETNANKGTTIEIRDLFFNTPARKKFLKTERTELSRIKDIILKEALANYNISFEVYLDDKQIFKTTGNSLDETIFEIFGKTNYKNLSKFNLGYLGNVNLIKGTRDYIYIYVNGRYVKSPILERAIINGYETKLMRGKYPFVIIFLEIDPHEIDINIDPNKKYIKFSNEQIVYKQLYNEIREFFYYKDREEWTANLSIENDDKFDNNEKIEYNILQKNVEYDKTLRVNEETENIYLGNKPFEEKQIGIFERSEGTKIYYDVLGQIFDTYILVQNREKQELEIYDQHIINEGILFEELKLSIKNKELKSQQLLIPKVLTLQPFEKELLMNNINIFIDFGFEIDEIGENKIAIRSVPLFKFRTSIETVFTQILDNLVNNQYKIKDIREEIIISMSCKGSIRAGMKLTMDEMQNMVRRLHEVKRYTCPHGRPIISKITKDELDKRFGRKK